MDQVYRWDSTTYRNKSDLCTFVARTEVSCPIKHLEQVAAEASDGLAGRAGDVKNPLLNF